MKTSAHNWIRPTALKSSFAVAMLALLAWTGFQPTLAQTYTITDLGVLGRATGPAGKASVSEAFAIGINNFGQVAGQSSDGQTYTLQYCIDCYKTGTLCPQKYHHCDDTTYDERHAFLWTPNAPNATNGSLTDLGTFGGPNSRANAITSDGQVLGVADISPKGIAQWVPDDYGCCIASQEYYGGLYFLWRPSLPTAQSGSISNSPVSGPEGINASGQIIYGQYLWQDGVTIDLGFSAKAINDAGQVVGYGSFGEGFVHAFLWQNGAKHDLGALDGDVSSVATDISTNGKQVVGQGSDSHMFLFTIDSSGQVISRTRLGELPGKPYKVNNSGQVVGSASIDYYNPPTAFFLWDSVHGIRDLNSLLPPGSGWVLRDVRGINDAGQIAASGENANGDHRALLLTPLPAPRLTFASSQPNGQFHFTLVGEAGRSYTIEVSSNLVNWTDWTNFVSANGTNQFTDPIARNFNRRFYRAVTP